MRKFLTNQKASIAAEYAFIVGFIAFAILGVLYLFRDQLAGLFEAIAAILPS